MRVCAKCGGETPIEAEQCSACGGVPARIDGFDAYASALAGQQQGYKDEFYDEYAHLEESHFWFSVRRELIVWALRTYAPRLSSYLEIGCGTGYVLDRIAGMFPGARLYGSEMLTAGLKFAARRVPGSTFFQMDARDIPFVDEFDAIGAFDVIEHIDDDVAVLRQMHRALKSGGVMLVTVPQHEWLWSEVDNFSCHVRRYASRDLHAKIDAAGFNIVRSTSFVSLLLPLLVLSRFKRQRNIANFDPLAELKIPKLLNVLFRVFMICEAKLIRLGVTFSMGGSRLVVAVKRD